MTVSIKPAFRNCLLPLQPYVPGSSTEEVAGRYAPIRISKMGSNENPLGPGPKAMEAVRNLAASLSVYPDASAGDLRAALAAAAGKKPGNFFVGNGSDEVLLLIAATYLNPGDQVLVGTHTFFNYEFVARVFDGEVHTIPTRDLRYDLPAFSAAADARTKLIFLCNPNNPTGLYFTHTDLAGFLYSLPRNVLVVVDEAYGEYADAEDFPDTAALMEDFPNLVAVRTFSKAYGLAGLRVGYAMASETIVKDLRQVKMPFNVNLPAQKAALAALGDAEHLERTLGLNGEGKRSLTRELEKLGCEVLPSQGNFLCFQPPGSAAAICEYLFRQGVIVRPLNRFGLDRWIRVTVGTQNQNSHFLEALSAFFSA
ncbi:MAG: histidinol-phosphate aminotransferase 2 [Fibrobacteres bacterium]|nr:histidinol-phosphate aminotransferase 2 [Fibrobacterota bacterium]